MSTLIELQIKTKIANIAFSDNSKVIERSSEIIIKDNDIGFSIDINGIDLAEAKRVREIVIIELQEIVDIGKINIVLTASEKKQKLQQWSVCQCEIFFLSSPSCFELSK